MALLSILPPDHSPTWHLFADTLQNSKTSKTISQQESLVRKSKFLVRIVIIIKLCHAAAAAATAQEQARKPSSLPAQGPVSFTDHLQRVFTTRYRGYLLLDFNDC